MDKLDTAIAEATFIWERIEMRYFDEVPAGIDISDKLTTVGWFERAHPAEYLRLRTAYRLGVR